MNRVSSPGRRVANDPETGGIPLGREKKQEAGRTTWMRGDRMAVRFEIPRSFRLMFRVDPPALPDMGCKHPAGGASGKAPGRQAENQMWKNHEVTLLFLVISIAGLLPYRTTAADRGNAVRIENQKTGTTEWLLTRVKVFAVGCQNRSQRPERV
jgi:hypothetical protein